MEARAQHIETSDGVTIGFWTSGESEDSVVLLPSLGRSGRDFYDLSRTLAEAGFRAVALDLRGVGESTGPLRGLTLHDLAADVAALVEALDCRAVHVVGHAFGNRVARCLAADHPGLVRSVVLLAAGGLVEPEPQARVDGLRCFQLNLPDAERLDAIRAGFFAPSSDPTVWRDGWWPSGAAAQETANRATPREDWWEAGSAPLLVIQGLDDRIAPPANGYALKETLGDRVQLVDLADAGHALLPEQPEAIAEAIIAFLRQH
jgi:pimeloyl-ACP methyl ester carboxylesterase